MVQNKQKSNKINITATITCFMLIMVFVFGCVQFAYAETTDDFVYGEEASKYISSSGKMLIVVKSKNEYFTCFYRTTFITPVNRRIALLRRDNGDSYSFDVYLENNSVVESGMVSSVLSRQETGKTDITTSFSSSYGPVNDVYLFNGQNIDSIDKTVGELVSVGCPVFDNKDDINTYLNTGEINNPIYQPTGYDESIPTPKNLEIYFDRKLNKPFNLADLCNPLKIKWTIPEDEDYSNYTLDVQIDVNYNKLNSISGIGTKPTVLQTGKVEFASCSATDKELNINATYDGWTKLTEKYHSSIWGLTGNYFDIWLRYKDSSGNYGNWVKVTINPDNSSTVIKAGLFDNGTNTTINKGYEEISGDNGEHVSGDYDNYYVGTADENISNNLTKLRENYTNLVSFFKELFGFLPAEIWVILIGLVATMAFIAVLMFVRG